MRQVPFSLENIWSIFFRLSLAFPLIFALDLFVVIFIKTRLAALSRQIIFRVIKLNVIQKKYHTRDKYFATTFGWSQIRSHERIHSPARRVKTIAMAAMRIFSRIGLISSFMFDLFSASKPSADHAYVRFHCNRAVSRARIRRVNSIQ